MQEKQKQKRSRKGKRGRGRRGPSDYTLSGVTRAPLLLPARFRGKMMYHSYHILAPAATAVAYNTFRMNSVYDPDFTGVGTTVTGYPQLAALYGRYRVTSSKISVDYINKSSSAPLTCFMVFNSSNNVGTDIKAILAQRFVWSRSIATLAGAGTTTHVGSAPIHLVYGVPKQQVLAEDDYAAVVGANPNNVVFAHVGAFCNDAAAGSFYLQVSMEFEVVWSLPLELSF